MAFILEEEIIKICNEFAEKCCPTNKDEYASRNQTNLEKIKKDIRIGKMAEFAVYYILKEKGLENLTPPDLNIYKKNEKSFDADLTCEGYKIHVKSQDVQSANAWGDSWTFQKEDPLIKLASDHDHFIGTKVDEKNRKVEIMLSRKVKDLIFGQPVLEKLRKFKVCVYLKDNN